MQTFLWSVREVRWFTLQSGLHSFSLLAPFLVFTLIFDFVYLDFTLFLKIADKKHQGL